MNQFIKSILKVSGLAWLKIIGFNFLGWGFYFMIEEDMNYFVFFFFIGFALIDLTPSLIKYIWRDCSPNS